MATRIARVAIIRHAGALRVQALEEAEIIFLAHDPCLDLVKESDHGHDQE